MLSFSPGHPERVDAENLNHHPTEPTETPSPLSLQSPAAQPLQPPPSGGLWTHLHVASMLPHDGIYRFPEQDGTSQRLIHAALRMKRDRQRIRRMKCFEENHDLWAQTQLNMRRSWKDFARFSFTHGILPVMCWELLFFCVLHGLWNMDFGETQALMILAFLIISVGISLCFLLFVYCPTCWAKVRVFGHG